MLASDGSLVAQSANIAGKLVAQSGSFVEGIYVSNINASSITTGTIDAERINVDALFAESITATNTITIGATGKITNATSDFELSSNGLSLALISGTVQGSEPSAIKWDPKIYIAGEASTIGGRESTLRIATQQLVIESNTGNGVGVQIFGDVDIDGFLESDYISATSGLASITSSLLYAPSTEVTGYLDVTGTLDVGANATFSSNVSIAKDLELSGNAIIDSIIIKLDNIPTSPSATANCVWVDANGFLRLS